MMNKKLILLTFSLFVLLCGLGISHPAQAYYTTSNDTNIRIHSIAEFTDNSFTGADSAAGLQIASRGTGLADKPNPAPQSQNVPYQVKPGDTLFQIARNFDTTVSALVNLNQIQNPEVLQVGQQIHVPAKNAAFLQGFGDKTIQVLNCTLTAYTAGYESTGKTPADPNYGVTASGSKVEDGRTIAVDPSVIPIGSTVYIEGIGIRKAEDTGGAIRGNRIDVYMNELPRAVTFGVKPNVKVYVLSNKQ